MKRGHPEAFEQARAVIESVLEELGFSLVEEHYRQRSFGSAHSVYWRRGTEVRLIWDGKDATLDADYTEGGTRRPLVEVTDGDKIQAIVSAVRAKFAGQ